MTSTAHPHRYASFASPPSKPGGEPSLLYFHQYQNALPGTSLADKAKTGTKIRTLGRDREALLSDFRGDVAGGRLPQVSWIVASPPCFPRPPRRRGTRACRPCRSPRRPPPVPGLVNSQLFDHASLI